MDNKTLEYYNQNAETFVSHTVDVDFTVTQNKFLSMLKGKKILDFGCGSGRDTKYFLDAGYDVAAIDGSEELCKIASVYTGIKVKHMLFQELFENTEYDGIWACSSILHLKQDDLVDVFERMKNALLPGGIIYTSFKYGEFEGERNGRYFIDFTYESFLDFIKNINGLSIKEHWVTGDVRPGRGEEKWLNLILQKD